MYQVLLTDKFDQWLNGLRDNPTKRRMARRLEKAQSGKLGDVKPVGESVR